MFINITHYSIDHLSSDRQQAPFLALESQKNSWEEKNIPRKDFGPLKTTKIVCNWIPPDDRCEKMEGHPIAEKLLLKKQKEGSIFREAFRKILNSEFSTEEKSPLEKDWYCLFSSGTICFEYYTRSFLGGRSALFSLPLCWQNKGSSSNCWGRFWRGKWIKSSTFSVRFLWKGEKSNRYILKGIPPLKF